MLFSSIPFLYYFLPLVLAVYFLTPARFRNAVLLLASLIFYAWGEPKYVLLMLASILSGYGFGLLQERYRGQKGAKLVCGLSVAVSLSFLLYFKYADFFLENFNAATGLGVPLLRIALPIGISFYTFQIISYTVDVYRGEPAQKNLIHLAAYVAMFPQLIAGPIVRYSDIAQQLEHRSHSTALAAEGVRRFLIGLGKKILIANQLGELCSVFRASDEKSVLFYWLYAVAFALHIYFDFSGYSDMAIGLGKVFGFHFLENFSYPYISASITEFWRRWHISLSSWVRDYLFLPLSSFTRRWGQWGVAASLMVTFIALGVWHGAGWTFAVYGFIQGLVIVWELRTERIRNKVRKHIGRRLFATLSVIRTYLIFAVSLVFFKAQSVSDAFYFLRNISFQTHASWKEINIGMSDHICIVAGAALLLMLLYDFFMSKGDLHRRLERQPILLRWTIYYLIVFALFAYGKFGTENFIYLQF